MKRKCCLSCAPNIPASISSSTRRTSSATWQAEWSEKTYDQGKFKGEKHFKGMFDVEIHSPTNITDIMRNPLGIFVSDFHVTEKISDPKP